MYDPFGQEGGKAITNPMEACRLNFNDEARSRRLCSLITMMTVTVTVCLIDVAVQMGEAIQKF